MKLSFPQMATVPIASSAIGANEYLFRIPVAFLPHPPPPLPYAFNRKLGCVRIHSNVHPPRIVPNCRKSHTALPWALPGRENRGSTPPPHGPSSPIRGHHSYNSQSIPFSWCRRKSPAPDRVKTVSPDHGYTETAGPDRDDPLPSDVFRLA